MAMVVQNSDGTASGANSYLSTAMFKDYHNDRGQSFGTATDDAIAGALVSATSYLDSRWSWNGKRKAGRDQTTAFPRFDLYDTEGYYVTDVPREVQYAVAEYALRALTSPLAPDPTVAATGFPVAATSESVGPISESVTYAVTGKAPPAFRPYPAADSILLRSGFIRLGNDLVRG